MKIPLATQNRVPARPNTVLPSVLLVHNFYKVAGGEDHSVESEVRLLQQRGHRITRFVDHNRRISKTNLLQVSANTIWNPTARQSVRDILRSERPDLVHIHNTFPLISPSVYYAARDEGIPVVQSFHNFRTLCANGLFFRNGQRCEECLDRQSFLPGLLHSCYRDSRLATAVVTGMLSLHTRLGTWRDLAASYITPSETCRQKFIAGGLPAERILVRYNFLDFDPGAGAGDGDYAVFSGRLSDEKGLRAVVEGWRKVPRQLSLRIFGDGPLGGWLAARLPEIPHVRWYGNRSRDEVITQLRHARMLIFASECYESAHPPLSIVEAFAVGVPVIASEFDGVARGVESGRTGLTFRVGDPSDLAMKVSWVLDHPAEWSAMRNGARREYETRHVPDTAYRGLMDAYSLALKNPRST